MPSDLGAQQVGNLTDAQNSGSRIQFDFSVLFNQIVVVQRNAEVRSWGGSIVQVLKHREDSMSRRLKVGVLQSVAGIVDGSKTTNIFLL